VSPDLLEVGRITKAHGLKGEVVVQLWSDLLDRLDPGSELHTDQGTLTVLSSRTYQDRYLVFFEGFVERTTAEGLQGLTLRAAPREVPGTLWVHELIGADVVLSDGTAVGVVASVEANPASDLLVLSDGRLIPLRFVVSHEPGATVVIDPPAGLLEL
jgi:16S rRNA processing protein RimM